MIERAVAGIGGTGAFVGRERELQVLLDGLDRARAGSGGLFLTGGEPGIGKSRLADEFARQARESGAVVLWGRCWEGAGAPPYWPWIQALRGQLRNVSPIEMRDLLGTGAADVAQLLPELRTIISDLPPAPPDSDSARFQLFDATSSFFRNVARDRGALLVLDDLHAADTASILLLRFVASQVGDMRLVVVGTYRDLELTSEHPLTGALAEMAREPTTRLLRVTGLAEEVVTGFIEATTGVMPAARLARQMWRETSGNPLFLAEAARLLVSERRLDESIVGGSLRLAVPASVRDVIARRVRQLSAATVEALTIGAALGPEFSTDAVHRIGGHLPGERMAVLDEATAAGLLLPVTGSLDRLRFSHDLVRESVYQEQSPARRAALHRRIADGLEDMYGSAVDQHAAELAHHYFEAARSGEADAAASAVRARGYAMQAGRAAVSSVAYEEAARLFRMALAMLELDAPTDDETRAEILLAIGDAEESSGEVESANAAFLEAAEIARRTGVAAHLARAALGVGGRLAWARPGHNRNVIPLLQEALARLGDSNDDLLVRVMSRLATAWRSSPDKREESDSLTREAVELARRLGDPATLSYALGARWWATWWPENPERRLPLALEMMELAESIRDRERMSDARLMLWYTHIELGDVVSAARESEEVRRLAEDLRQPAHRWLSVASTVVVALLAGDYALAEQAIQREMAPGPPSTPARDNESAASLHWFLLSRERGRSAEAERRVRAAARDYPWYPFQRAALVLLLMDLGHDTEARAVFGALARDDFSALYRDNEWLLGMCLASEACALLGDATAAQTLYAQLAPFAGRHAIGHADGSVGAVDRYLGLVAATAGRPDEAVRHLADAVDLNERIGARPWAAHTRHDLARVLRDRQSPTDIERAATLEANALETAQELGMTALLARLAVSKEPPDSAAAEESDAAPPSPAVFRREGEYWTIGFGGQSFRLGDAKGLRYLARLLAEPGREILALDLVREGGGEPDRGAAPADPDLTAGGLGDAGAHLDPAAKAAYGERLRELRQELAEAERFNDPERAARTQEEIDFLARELSRAIGLGGRDRSAASASERARVSVTRAIRGAMTRIARHNPSLGEHVETTIHTGTYCAYRPDSRITIQWEL